MLWYGKLNIDGAGTYIRELAGDSGRYTSWSSLWYNIPATYIWINIHVH